MILTAAWCLFYFHGPGQYSVLPVLRCRCEMNFLRILSLINIEISGFIAIYIILESLSLHILLFLKWKMKAENAVMPSPIMYMLVYEILCLHSHMLTLCCYVSNSMFGHVLVFRNIIKGSQGKF